MKNETDRYTRVRWLLGDEWERLQNARVLVLGAGGVGGVCADALARSGVGEIVLVDKDVFDITNQNRQIYSEAVGADKVGEFATRYKNVRGIKAVVDVAFLESIRLSEFDVIIDAIDDVPAKIALALRTPKDRLISSMGGAKRLDATAVKVASVWKTHSDPFARKIRSELKRAGFGGDYPVVFSTELPNCVGLGSFMGVTAVFGLNLASLAVRKILGLV
ncbi:ThiF family adenylyltransferase [Campylobacter sp. 19-13652]|uniref:tRNA threonylcarbamoyladenosine dehydratase n=1 Tax=Campylobacter sp. 19-13652 TaxID=2840180 RepID=UPI001C85799C|nr:ThiF family adenylyltransferase [Campylobacter sp. 19-13652]